MNPLDNTHQICQSATKVTSNGSEQHLIIRGKCPRCSKPTELTHTRSCQNRYGNEKICGYKLPESLDDCWAAKVKKRVTMPTGVFSGERSYNPSPQFYVDNLRSTLHSGAIYFDSDKEYFSAFFTPSGEQGIAKIFSGSPMNNIPASGYSVPLNSKLQKLHGRYQNFESGMVPICEPGFVTIELFPPQFNVYKRGELIASWNDQFKTGVGIYQSNISGFLGCLE
jgi:hypothetical protein